MRFRRVAILCLVLAGCGGSSGSSGGSGSGSPTTPTPVQQNRPPVINSLSISPAFGIASITAFVYAASASDPDNDPLSYTWDVAGNAASGSSGQATFGNGFQGTATVTVSDGKGGSTSDSRPFTVGSMTGEWTGSNAVLGTFTMSLTQTGAFITGTYGDSDVAKYGPGRTDPAQPGIIRPDASVEIRMKQGRFTDFTFRGTMDNTGRRVSGGIFGSGFTGQPFVMSK